MVVIQGQQLLTQAGYSSSDIDQLRQTAESQSIEKVIVSEGKGGMPQLTKIHRQGHAVETRIGRGVNYPSGIHTTRDAGQEYVITKEGAKTWGFDYAPTHVEGGVTYKIGLSDKGQMQATDVATGKVSKITPGGEIEQRSTVMVETRGEPIAMAAGTVGTTALPPSGAVLAQQAYQRGEIGQRQAMQEIALSRAAAKKQEFEAGIKERYGVEGTEEFQEKIDATRRFPHAQKKMYGEYSAFAESYNKDIENYNRIARQQQIEGFQSTQQKFGEISPEITYSTKDFKKKERKPLDFTVDFFGKPRKPTPVTSFGTPTGLSVDLSRISEKKRAKAEVISAAKRTPKGEQVGFVKMGFPKPTGKDIYEAAEKKTLLGEPPIVYRNGKPSYTGYAELAKLEHAHAQWLETVPMASVITGLPEVVRKKGTQPAYEPGFPADPGYFTKYVVSQAGAQAALGATVGTATGIPFIGTAAGFIRGGIYGTAFGLGAYGTGYATEQLMPELPSSEKWAQEIIMREQKKGEIYEALGGKKYEYKTGVFAETSYPGKRGKRKAAETLALLGGLATEAAAVKFMPNIEEMLEEGLLKGYELSYKVEAPLTMETDAAKRYGLAGDAKIKLDIKGKGVRADLARYIYGTKKTKVIPVDFQAAITGERPLTVEELKGFGFERSYTEFGKGQTTETFKTFAPQPEAGTIGPFTSPSREYFRTGTIVQQTPGLKEQFGLIKPWFMEETITGASRTGGTTFFHYGKIDPTSIQFERVMGYFPEEHIQPALGTVLWKAEKTGMTKDLASFFDLPEDIIKRELSVTMYSEVPLRGKGGFYQPAGLGGLTPEEKLLGVHVLDVPSLDIRYPARIVVDPYFTTVGQPLSPGYVFRHETAHSMQFLKGGKDLYRWDLAHKFRPLEIQASEFAEFAKFSAKINKGLADDFIASKLYAKTTGDITGGYITTAKGKVIPYEAKIGVELAGGEFSKGLTEMGGPLKGTFDLGLGIGPAGKVKTLEFVDTSSLLSITKPVVKVSAGRAAGAARAPTTLNEALGGKGSKMAMLMGGGETEKAITLTFAGQRAGAAATAAIVEAMTIPKMATATIAIPGSYAALATGLGRMQPLPAYKPPATTRTAFDQINQFPKPKETIRQDFLKVAGFELPKQGDFLAMPTRTVARENELEKAAKRIQQEMAHITITTPAFMAGTRETMLTATKPATAQRVVPAQRQVFFETTDIMAAFKTAPRITTAQRTAQRTAQKTTPTTQFAPIMPTPTIGFVPLLLPMFPGKTMKSMFPTTSGFKVLVRGKGQYLGGKWMPGKFKAASEFVMPRAVALAFGQKLVAGTAKRTFKIEPSFGKFISPKLPGFRPEMFAKKGRRYTEKVKFAIDTFGEREEITRKGLKALNLSALSFFAPRKASKKRKKKTNKKKKTKGR